MQSDLIKTEGELKKRLTYPYKWGRKQNNEFDKLTNFIYHNSRDVTLEKNIFSYKDMSLAEKKYPIYIRYTYLFLSMYLSKPFAASTVGFKSRLFSNKCAV